MFSSPYKWVLLLVNWLPLGETTGKKLPHTIEDFSFGANPEAFTNWRKFVTKIVIFLVSKWVMLEKGNLWETRKFSDVCNQNRSLMNNQNNPNKVKNLSCYYCGKKGHLKWECNFQKSKEKKLKTQIFWNENFKNLLLWFLSCMLEWLLNCIWQQEVNLLICGMIQDSSCPQW